MSRPEKHPTRLVYELLAHDDTARPTGGSALGQHWQVHLGYLRDLQRRRREALARTVGESA